MKILIACEESQRVCSAFRELQPTNIVEPPLRQQLKSGKSMPEWYSNAPKAERSKIRSKTFPGFAKAMAEQWGGNIL